MRSGGMHGIARGWGAACILVLPVLLLGSCMHVAPAPALSAEQARDDYRAVLDDTQRLIGGDWVDQDDPTPRSCLVQWGLSGESFASLRISSAAASPRVLDWIQRQWERDGYSVERTAIGPVSQLTATTGLTGELMILRVSDRGMTLQGESACRPAE